MITRAQLWGLGLILFLVSMTGASAYMYGDYSRFATYTDTSGAIQYQQFPVTSSTHIYQDGRGVYYTSEQQYVYGMSRTTGFKAWSGSPCWTCIGSGCGKTPYTQRQGSQVYRPSYGYFYQYSNPAVSNNYNN